MTEIRFKNLRFLITDSPNDENIQAFIDVRQLRELKTKQIRR